jgi:DNA-binding CsgD family transcriptional regulator
VTEDDLDARLIEMATAFMAAPLEPDGWDIALRKMAEHTGAARGQLVAFGLHHVIPFNKVTDEPDDWGEDFTAIDGGNPAVNWRVACARAPLEVICEQDYEQARSRLKSDIYSDYARQYDIVNGCQTVLSQDRNMFFGLATLRTAADGVTTEDQRAFFAQVAPIALSAVKMQLALEHRGAQLVADAFDAMNAIAFLMDVQGCVTAATEAAADFLAQQDCPLRLSAHRLTALYGADNRALQQGIGETLNGLNAAPPRIWLSGKALCDGYICEIFALPPREMGFGHEPRLLMIVRRAKGRSADTSLLRRVLKLTTAEAEVAKLVGDGLSREQIAEHRGTSTGTVHAQLKSLFHKAHVSREAELVALVNSLLN